MYTYCSNFVVVLVGLDVNPVYVGPICTVLKIQNVCKLSYNSAIKVSFMEQLHALGISLLQ